jgi:membrane protease subunit (stomatin/prohibitin family)
VAIIDRIKFDGMLNGKDWLVYRYPGESFVMGTQLIVGEGQVAVFVKGGQALDYFTAGTYTLNTSNVPLLQGIINLPFGGKTPFTAEIYFINKTSKLDIAWGTTDPIQLIDPKYNIKLRIRAFGQFGMKIDDYRVFLTELIGAMNPLEVVNYNKLLMYFKGLLVMKTKSLIAQAIIKNKVSALEIAASIDEISDYCKDEVSEEFDRFGVRVVNFYVQSINFPDEDFEQINKILQDKASFDIIGDARYVTKRSFDTMETAAGNEGGMAGVMAGAGAGLGVGLGFGGIMSNTTHNLNTSIPGRSLKCTKCGSDNSADAAFCMECGNRLAKLKIKCHKCGAEVPEDGKFCSMCGELLNKKNICSNCNTENDIGAKFCKDCGTRLEM